MCSGFMLQRYQKLRVYKDSHNRLPICLHGIKTPAERPVARPELGNTKIGQPTKAIRYRAHSCIKKVRTFNKDSGSVKDGFS